MVHHCQRRALRGMDEHRWMESLRSYTEGVERHGGDRRKNLAAAPNGKA